MARFNHINGYHINGDLVRYIQEMSSTADGPKDSCAIYFAGTEKPLYMEGMPAAKVVGFLTRV